MSGLGNNPTRTVPRLLSNLEVAVGVVFVIFGAISFIGYLHPRIPVSGITQDGGLWLLLDALLLPIGSRPASYCGMRVDIDGRVNCS